MTKNDIQPMPEYFDRYINMAADGNIIAALKISLDELKNAPLDRWKAHGDRVYAAGKWTIKDILQHIVDTERIFGYRALCIARGETVQLPSYDEATYAQNGAATRRSLEDLVAEMIVNRQSLIALYESFLPDMLLRSGLSFKGTYSVLAIGYVLAGHQRWHFKIIDERYLNSIA
jgi:hypothetical protein